MAAPDSVKQALVAEAADDFLGFWEVLWVVCNDLAVTGKKEQRGRTLQIVRDLLAEGLLVPGFPIGEGPDFDSWDVSVDEAMKRFKEAWDALDDDPFTGDIAWFVATPKGELWLKEHSEPAPNSRPKSES